MHYVSCNFCGQDKASLVNRGPDLLLDRWADTFQLVRCRNCQLIYQNPQLTPDELADHYPEDYICFGASAANARSLGARIDGYFGLGRRIRQVQRYRPQPGALLDIGCAKGHFLAAMRQRGWRVTGVDTNAYAAAQARTTFDLDVRAGTLQAAGLPPRAYEVVTLWGVFEHVADPKATLAEIVRILQPGGLVAMALPNPNCLEAKLFGQDWVGWDRPRHLHIFSPQVIARYLAQAGLVLRSIESFSGRLGLTLLNWEFWCKARRIPAARWRPILRALYNWPLRIMTWPAYRVAEVFLQTSNMSVFATRPL